MKIDEYITKLRNENNVFISVSNDEIKIKASQKDLTNDLIADIKARKREILDFFQSINIKNSTIPAVVEQDYYPLSYGQRRLWVMDELVDIEGLYNVPIVCDFDSLNIDAFDKALKALIDRHEILRTTIHTIEGEPRQKVNDIEDLKFELVSYDTDKDIVEVIKNEIFIALDLSISPIRASIVKLPSGEQCFVFILHHIVTDGWSTRILLKELMYLYAHYNEGSELNLPVLDIQYKDYAQWQLDNVESGKLNLSREYWHSKLSGDLPEVELPLDNKREKAKNYTGSEVSVDIPVESLKQLVKLGQEYDATLFMVLVGALNSLLYRYTEQEDIILGTPVMGRDLPQLDNQIGYYSNLIVLRNSIDGSGDFIQHLKQVREVVLESIEHQYYPFDLLVDELNPKRDINRNPLFDVIISYEESNETTETGEGESGNVTNRDGGVNKFDLSFSFRRIGEKSLTLNVNYNNSLFSNSKVVRMARHIQTLLSEIAGNKHQPISDIQILSASEKDKIIKSFNKVETFPLNKSIKDLIEDQVIKTPNATSLIFKGDFMSYAEMNQQANQLANILSSNHNVKKGDYVGISMKTGTDRIIAIIGLIKLGAIYVPLDADFPKSRMSYIIDDTKLSILISDFDSCYNITEEANGFLILFFENLLEDFTKTSGENPAVAIMPDDIFTVLYTSGSTGKPKGVELKNIGLVNLVNWQWLNCSYNADSVSYQRANIIFDLTLAETFVPLCFGAKLLIADDGNTGQEVVDNIVNNNVTHLGFSPTNLNRFLEQDRDLLNRITSLKSVYSAGEELKKSVTDKYCAIFDVDLVNYYGPTEASVYATCYEFDPERGEVPIGRPISNVKIFILDKNHQLLPIGITGEICIGGVGLAKGYLNKGDLTKEKFINDPYDESEYSRLYKTGDIGYWNEEGEIIFLGRRDNQVSIWGTRIELDEIECAILEHPKVREVAVVTSSDDYDNDHIVAYYVKKDSGHLNESGAASEITPLPDGEFDNMGSVKDYVIDGDLSSFIEKSAIKNQDKVALIFEKEQITYGLLNKHVNSLAKYIKHHHNIGKGDLVGVVMEKSDKLVISILSILKCGAAYVPIDPDYPETRISYIINDSMLKLAILDSVNAPKITDDRVIKVNYDSIDLDKEVLPELLSSDRASVNDLCYVYYTSGSTGNPKGVMTEHYSVIDYVKTFNEFFELTSNDIVAQQSSISFDTSVEEMFPILSVGGTLAILPKGGRDIEAIIQSINDEGITVLSSTPLVINELNMRIGEMSRIPRVIISGGDELRSAYIDNIYDKTSLYNTYGPTEATVCASFAYVNDLDKCKTIGKPINNHGIHILGDDMEKVKHGQIGEIHISGPGLARGYINNEKETLEKFVPGANNEGRLYKTGDLGRWNSEGFLEFCGRKDKQVKIKGYRVEPSEVDVAIKKHVDVISSYTTSKIGLEGVKHLVTYYNTVKENFGQDDLRSFLNGQLPHYLVPDYFVKLSELPKTINGKIDGSKLPIPEKLMSGSTFNFELRAFLKKRLPAYMVPSRSIGLDKLPLTATGKIDRILLKNRKLSFNTSEAYFEPSNDAEKKILEVWKKCLNQTKIGRDSNFFEVGGNSIKATQVISTIYREMGCEISLKDVFNNPTIQELSKVTMRKSIDQDLTISFSKKQSHLREIFFIPPIIGSSTIFKELADQLSTPFNIYGLQYKGFDYEVPFDLSIEEMAKTFANEIKRTNSGESVSLIGYSMGATIGFETAKTLEKQGFDVDLIIIDRAVNDNNISNDQATNNSHINNDQTEEHTLENELGQWHNAIKKNDFERVKKLVLHNLSILPKYEVSGTIKGRIFAIEAEKNTNKSDIEKWRDHTTGAFEHCKIDAYHYTILAEENRRTLSKLLDSMLAQHDIEKVIYQE